MISYSGYHYAESIRRKCEELHEKLGVVPVKGYAYKKDKLLGTQWIHVLCHPDDQDEVDVKKFAHPYRDI